MRACLDEEEGWGKLAFGNKPPFFFQMNWLCSRLSSRVIIICILIKTSKTTQTKVI